MSNIYLNNFDKNMVNHGFQIIRYCDDMLILTKNEEELKDAELLLNFELKKLKLQTNLDKTQKGDLRKGFVFLGYHFNQTGRIASKKAVESLDCKLKNLAIDKKVDDEKIEKVIRGWENYFGSIKNITLNNLESFLSVLKVKSHHEVEKLLEDRNKIQAIAKPNVYLELAIEWKKLAQENMFIKEVAEFFKYVQLYDQMELIKMSELLSISLENLVNIIRNYKKNNFDLGFLAESFVEISSYYLAQKFYELRNETTKLTFNNYGLDCLDEIFFDKYLNLFSGKENIYSIERCDKTGKKVFEKVKRTLKAEQIQEHIEGAITADLHLFKDNYHTSLLVLDIDISKECLSDDENYHRNLKLTLEYALKLSKQAKSYGIDNLIEFSGYKGYHVWFFFEKEVLASKLRDFAFYLLKQVGSCPDGIRCEIFPNKNELIDIEESCVIKLPLGFNSITEARCLFIDNKGNYYPDQRKIVEITKKIDLKTFYEVLKVLEIEKDLVNKDVCLKEETFENLPKTKKVIDNCKVVEFIVKKAEATGYLNHKERTLLLSSIGTLDKEGKEAIHKIMKKCFNYDKGITEKYFNKKFDSPISCKKIKENYREITCLTDCNCVFKNIPKDSYVSPTLYAKESLEKPKPIVKEISEKIELTTKEEPLNIKKKEEKVIVTEKTVEKNATLEIKTTPDNKAIKDDIKENIKKYANLKKQLRGIEKALEKCSDNLNSSFNTLKIEQIELEFGILIREKLNNKINWRLEL